jgi:hypothetical protein
LDQSTQLVKLRNKVTQLQLEKFASPQVAKVVATYQSRGQVGVNTNFDAVQIVCSTAQPAQPVAGQDETAMCRQLRNDLAKCLGEPGERGSFTANQVDLSMHSISYYEDEPDYVFWQVRFYVDRFANNNNNNNNNNDNNNNNNNNTVDLVTTPMTVDEFAASQYLPECFWDGSQMWCTPSRPYVGHAGHAGHAGHVEHVARNMMLDDVALQYLASRISRINKQTKQTKQTKLVLPAAIRLHDKTSFGHVRDIQIGNYKVGDLYDMPDKQNVIHAIPFAEPVCWVSCC